MMSAAMYWQGICTTIRSLMRSCKTCLTSKRQKLKYGHLLPKTVISTPWERLCVNLIDPYNLEGRDHLQIDFMDLTMINPACSWFEMVELHLVTCLQRQTVNCKDLLTADQIFQQDLQLHRKTSK
jgi:hypothetical protein